MSVGFSEALRIAAAACYRSFREFGSDVRLVRDGDGRIQFVVNAARVDVSNAEIARLAQAGAALGIYGAPESIRFSDEFAGNGEEFFRDGWCRTQFAGSDDSDFDVLVRDLTAWGRDWLWLHEQRLTEHPRVVFHGLKGGVGRSTALAVFAYMAARDGKTVLVIDLDLESPGVSGLLLPNDELPEYGVVDWLVEDRLGQGAALLGDMVVESPLSRNEQGSILVSPSMGRSETEYLSKLARAYHDIQAPRPMERRFSDRLSDLVGALEGRYRPDVVLIDSRAGLHEIASVAISRLADLTLLFAVDGTQNWSGYRQLFSHWNSRPEVLRRVRERLIIVRALAGDRARSAGFQVFLESSFDLFNSFLYDEVPAGDAGADLFTFDLADTNAPHFPPIVHWDVRFQEFDPLLPAERGGISVSQIRLAFESFFTRVYTALGWDYR